MPAELFQSGLASSFVHATEVILGRFQCFNSGYPSRPSIFPVGCLIGKSLCDPQNGIMSQRQRQRKINQSSSGNVEVFLWSRDRGVPSRRFGIQEMMTQADNNEAITVNTITSLRNFFGDEEHAWSMR
jgi:hypothetical protein